MGGRRVENLFRQRYTQRKYNRHKKHQMQEPKAFRFRPRKEQRWFCESDLKLFATALRNIKASYQKVIVLIMYELFPITLRFVDSLDPIKLFCMILLSVFVWYLPMLCLLWPAIIHGGSVLVLRCRRVNNGPRSQPLIFLCRILSGDECIMHLVNRLRLVVTVLADRFVCLRVPNQTSKML